MNLAIRASSAAGIFPGNPPGITLMRLGFQSAPPYQTTSPAGVMPTAPRTPSVFSAPLNWAIAHQTSGGYNGREFCRYRHLVTAENNSAVCGWGDSAYRNEPGGSGAAGQENWPQELFFRLRVRIYAPMLPVGVTGGLKFFEWHKDVYGGDQRIFIHFKPGSFWGEHADEDGMYAQISRNIFAAGPTLTDADEVARVWLPAGQTVADWHSCQFAARFGVEGISRLRSWKDNNVEASPTEEDTTLPTVPSQPGGTSEWLQSQTALDGQWTFGNQATNDLEVEAESNYDLDTFEIGTNFDPAFHAPA